MAFMKIWKPFLYSVFDDDACSDEGYGSVLPTMICLSYYHQLYLTEAPVLKYCLLTKGLFKGRYRFFLGFVTYDVMENDADEGQMAGK
jgi:hypothetical protein